MAADSGPDKALLPSSLSWIASAAEAATSTPLQRFFCAGVGAGVAEMLTLPVDAAKVRLQLQASGSGSTAPKYTGMLQGMWRIGSDEGIAALWRGFEPALVRQVRALARWRSIRAAAAAGSAPAASRPLHVPPLARQVSYTGMSFVLYEPVRNAIAGDVPRNEIPFYKRVLAGGTAGGISIIMVNPTDVIKTQMQAHKGDTAPRMRDIFSGVMRNAGVGGLWRGWQPNVARCFIGNACEIGCYDEVKTRIVGAVRHCLPKVPDTSVS